MDKPNLEGRHPSTTGILEFFDYGHLFGPLQPISEKVGDLAFEIVDLVPDDPELSAGLRHLMEAKDCFVRAKVRAMKKEGNAPGPNTSELDKGEESAGVE